MKLYKKVTKGGAVGIPVRLRRESGLMPGDGVSVEEKEGVLVITPQEKRCIFCGSTKTELEEQSKPVHIYKGKLVCGVCMKELEVHQEGGE